MICVCWWHWHDRPWYSVVSPVFGYTYFTELAPSSAREWRRHPTPGIIWIVTCPCRWRPVDQHDGDITTNPDDRHQQLETDSLWWWCLPQHTWRRRYSCFQLTFHIPSWIGWGDIIGNACCVCSSSLPHNLAGGYWYSGWMWWSQHQLVPVNHDLLPMNHRWCSIIG